MSRLKLRWVENTDCAALLHAPPSKVVSPYTQGSPGMLTCILFFGISASVCHQDVQFLRYTICSRLTYAKVVSRYLTCYTPLVGCGIQYPVLG